MKLAGVSPFSARIRYDCSDAQWPSKVFRRPERAITVAAVDKLRTLKTSQLFIGFSFMCLNDLKTSEHRKSFSFKIFIFVAHLAAPWSLLPGAVAPLAHHSHTFCYASISPIRIHSVCRALRDRLLGMRVCIPPGAIMFVLFVLYSKDKRQKPGQSGQRSTDKEQRQPKKIPAESRYFYIFQKLSSARGPTQSSVRLVPGLYPGCKLTGP